MIVSLRDRRSWLRPLSVRWPVLCICSGIIGLAAVASGFEGEPDTVEDPTWRLERFQRTVAVAAGTPIEIVNPIGDIRVRAAGAQAPELIANIQVLATDTDPPRVDLVKDDGTLRIVVRTSSPVSGRLPRADLTFYSPSGSDLWLSTGDGLVEAKGISGAVNAETDAGNIVIGAAGPITSKTVRGATTVTFSAARWDRPSLLESVTGDITARLAREADVTVHIDTIGQIGTDYSIEITPTGHGMRKQARARVGSGTSKLSLVSERGQVNLLRTWFD